MADEVGVVGAQGGIKGDRERALGARGDGDVGEGDALGDEESAGCEVLFECVEGTDLAFQDRGVQLEYK